MSAAPPVDPGVEREIDLGALKDAVLARWWIAVVGLVVGVAIGAAYTLSFGTTWAASAIIAPGQAFSPNGNTVVLSYLSSQRAIDTLANSETTLADVSAKTGVPVDKLDGPRPDEDDRPGIAHLFDHGDAQEAPAGRGRCERDRRRRSRTRRLRRMSLSRSRSTASGSPTTRCG